MSTHPSEVIQRGRTEFWENIRDKNLDDYSKTLDGMRIWRPIDSLRRRHRLRRLQDFIVRATVIIDESRAADAELCREKSTSEQICAAAALWYDEQTRNEQLQKETYACALWNITCQKLVREDESVLEHEA